MRNFFQTMDKIKPVYDWADKIVMFICKILLIVDILVATFQVVGRYIPFIPNPAWTEETVLTCMAYMAVLSAALAIRRNGHIRMTVFDKYLPEKLVSFLDVLADVAVFILGIIMLVYGWQFAVKLGSKGTYVSMPFLSKFWQYFPIPLAGAAMMIFELESFYNNVKKLIYGKEEK